MTDDHMFLVDKWTPERTVRELSNGDFSTVGKPALSRCKSLYVWMIYLFANCCASRKG